MIFSSHFDSVKQMERSTSQSTVHFVQERGEPVDIGIKVGVPAPLRWAPNIGHFGGTVTTVLIHLDCQVLLSRVSS
jgi:hypothetical protein